MWAPPGTRARRRAHFLTLLGGCPCFAFECGRGDAFWHLCWACAGREKRGGGTAETGVASQVLQLPGEAKGEGEEQRGGGLHALERARQLGPRVLGEGGGVEGGVARLRVGGGRDPPPPIIQTKRAGIPAWVFARARARNRPPKRAARSPAGGCERRPPATPTST